MQTSGGIVVIQYNLLQSMFDSQIQGTPFLLQSTHPDRRNASNHTPTDSLGPCKTAWHTAVILLAIT